MIIIILLIVIITIRIPVAGRVASDKSHSQRLACSLPLVCVCGMRLSVASGPDDRQTLKPISLVCFGCDFVYSRNAVDCASG